MSIESDTEFLEMVIYFINEKGDPTRYTDYDEERFRRVAPTLHAAWISHKLSYDTLHRLARDHKDHDLG